MSCAAGCRPGDSKHSASVPTPAYYAYRGSQYTILQWIQLVKPTQKAYTKRCNGSPRRESLDTPPFRSLAHVHQLVAGWLRDCNLQGPHQVLNFIAPIECKPNLY
ncbi:transposase [Hymenobacter setariae]|uniref:Transposase n=1 Tax=Hymenobacter setariae TaxID=2594794 RepID=A0A558BS15_9BACT|nr:transposase [Hymenobacter setariae]